MQWGYFIIVLILLVGFILGILFYVCQKKCCANNYRYVHATNISSPFPPRSGFRINGRDTSSLPITAPVLGFRHPLNMPRPELSMTTVTPHLNAEPPYPVEDTLYPPSSTRYSSEGLHVVPVHLSNRSCPYPPEPILDDITPRNSYPPYPTGRRTNGIPTVDDIAHRTPYPPDPNSRSSINNTSFSVPYPSESSTSETRNINPYPPNRAPYPDTEPHETISFRQHTNVTPYPPNRSLDSRDLHTTNLANNDRPPSYTEAMRNNQHS